MAAAERAQPSGAGVVPKAAPKAWKPQQEVPLTRAKARALADAADAYEVLGVGQHANIGDIKKAYRLMALRAHPDKGGDPSEFHTLTAAFEKIMAQRAEVSSPQQFSSQDIESASALIGMLRDVRNERWGLRIAVMPTATLRALLEVLRGGPHPDIRGAAKSPSGAAAKVAQGSLPAIMEGTVHSGGNLSGLYMDRGRKWATFGVCKTFEHLLIEVREIPDLEKAVETLASIISYVALARAKLAAGSTFLEAASVFNHATIGAQYRIRIRRRPIQGDDATEGGESSGAPSSGQPSAVYTPKTTDAETALVHFSTLSGPGWRFLDVRQQTETFRTDLAAVRAQNTDWQARLVDLVTTELQTREQREREEKESRPKPGAQEWTPTASTKVQVWRVRLKRKQPAPLVLVSLPAKRRLTGKERRDAVQTKIVAHLSVKAEARVPVPWLYRLADQLKVTQKVMGKAMTVAANSPEVQAALQKKIKSLIRKGVVSDV